MSVKIINRNKTKLTLQIEIDLDENSMLNSEELILTALNAAGNEATKVALLQFDTDGSPIEKDNKKWSSKGSKKKFTKPLMEK